MVEFVLSLISLPEILALPWIVQVPGLLLILLFIVRALRSFFSLKLITMATSVIWALAIAIILSRYGQAIATLVQSQSQPAA